MCNSLARSEPGMEAKLEAAAAEVCAMTPAPPLPTECALTPPCLGSLADKKIVGVICADPQGMCVSGAPPPRP